MRLYTPSHFCVRHAIDRKNGTASDWSLGIRFAADGSTWATNGYMLLRFSAPEDPPVEYPKVEGLDLSGTPLVPFTLSLADAETVRKAIPTERQVYMPILRRAALQTMGLPESVVFATTDLSAQRLCHAKPLADEATEQWSRAEKILQEAREQDGQKAAPVAFDTALLARLCKAVAEVWAGRLNAPLRWQGSEDPLKPIYAYSENVDIGRLEVVLMPMRV